MRNAKRAMRFLASVISRSSGLLHLQKGIWNGTRLLSAAWAFEATLRALRDRALAIDTQHDVRCGDTKPPRHRQASTFRRAVPARRAAAPRAAAASARRDADPVPAQSGSASSSIGIAWE